MRESRQIPVLIGLAAVLLLWLTGIPLAILIITSVVPQGTLGIGSGTLTLQNFVALFSQPDFLRLIANTANYVFGTIAIALSLATIWSWITERTDFRFKVLVRILMIMTIGLPPLIQGFGWILLLNPNNGYVNHLLRSAFSLDSSPGPINVYSMGVMVAVSGVMLTPTAYLMLSGVVKNLDYKLEFPAILAGVAPWRILTNIIVPILLPGLLALLIFTLMIMIQVFDIPLSIGLTAGIHVLSTRIYLLSTADFGQPNWNLAAAFGVMLILIAVALVLFYRKMTKLSERFAVISGKQYQLVAAPLRTWRYAVYVFATTFFVISLSPVLILLWTSFMPVYRVPSLASLSTASLQNYLELFDSATFLNGFGNTVIVVFSVSLMTMMISLLVSYVAVRTNGFMSRFVDILSFVPIAIPHIVLGLAVLLLYVRTPLYGTIAAIILAQISVNMVFGVRAISAGLLQLNPDLERAAYIGGVRRTTVITRIVVPLLRSQIFNGWLFVFAHAMRDLAIPLVFLTSETIVLSSALWLIWNYPNIPGAAAMSMVLVVFMIVVVTPLQIYLSRFDERMR